MSQPTDKSSKPSVDRLTTSAGNPIADNQNSLSAGPRGPLLLQDYQLIEKLAHQNRERIPERPVHDGAMRFYDNNTNKLAAYYEPNSFDGPKENKRYAEPALPLHGYANRYDHRDGNDDYKQAG